MSNKETTLSKVKVGDLIWGTSSRRSFPRLITRITDSMVFSSDYRLATPDAYLINNPDYFTTLNLKGLKTWGDMWNGGASFPIKGNEHLVKLGPETKEKKHSKFRGNVRECMAFVVSGKDAEIKYDFYAG